MTSTQLKHTRALVGGYVLNWIQVMTFVVWVFCNNKYTRQSSRLKII
mgnify:FL=1